jgi:hypothetical protein
MLTSQNVSEPAGIRDTDNRPNRPTATTLSARSPLNRFQDAGLSSQAREQEDLEPAGTRDTDSRPNHPARTNTTSKSPSHHAQHAGSSRQAQDQECDVYGTDSVAQYNDLNTPMALNANDRRPAPTSVFADSPQTYGQEVMDEEQGSDSEEEMTYVGWEKVRSGHTTALEVEPRPPGPEIGSLDQDMYDDYDEQMPSLGEQVDEESNKAETSMAAAEQTQCKSVSQLPSPWSSLIDPGIWISGTASSSRSRV